MTNLPAHRDDHTPAAQQPVHANVIPATLLPAEWRIADCIPLAATSATRDPAAAIEDFAEYLLHEIVPFVRGTWRHTIERQPVWCPGGCHTDLRQLTMSQQEEHWDRHSYWSKRQAKRRAGWR